MLRWGVTAFSILSPKISNERLTESRESGHLEDRMYKITVAAFALAALIGCGSGSDDNGGNPDAGSGNDATLTFGDGGSKVATSLAITPSSTTLDVSNGIPATAQFQATATYADNTTAQVQAQWSADDPTVGAIDNGGAFKATGLLGGVVNITAKYQTLSASAVLTVKLHVASNPANASSAIQTALTGATTPDSAINWAYPYDQTVFPRGLTETPLMWFGGAAPDVYYVQLTSPTFELTTFVTAPGQRYDFDQTIWSQFINSSSGGAELKVARWNGSAAAVAVDQHWTIGNGSMRGTIYYWAINTGNVMRIQPGASSPQQFVTGGVACPSCHTVSANGNHLVMNTGNWPSETSVDYDLGTSSNAFSGMSVNSGASAWAQAGVSADGSVVVQNFAPLRGNIGTTTGAFDAVTAAQIPSTGLEGIQMWMPAFSPDDKLIAYVDSSTGDLRAFDWDATNKKASNGRLIMAAGTNASTKVIQFPTVSPDHNWIVYQRASQLGSLGNPGDLYVASVASPGTEQALDALNGKTYPFAAGTRDRDLSFEPTFAPVAAGGYFWLVFHSRRTFGNALTGPAYVSEGNGVKQLWIAAFDQAPKNNVDPSHAAFHLEGQDTTTENMRGYWALAPCKGDGQGCQSGTDCCGGYCTPTADAGLVCGSTPNGCSQVGDKCTTAADCCGANSGVTCINSHCASPTPN